MDVASVTPSMFIPRKYDSASHQQKPRKITNVVRLLLRGASFGFRSYL